MLVDEMRTMDVESRNGLMRRDNATQTQKALDLEYKMLVQRTKNNQFELELENRRRKLLDERARMYDDAARRLQQERDVQFPSLIYAQSPSFDYHPYNSGNRRAPSPTAFFYKEERPDPIAYVSDQYRKHEKGRATTNRQKESSRSEEAGSGGGGGGKKRGVADAFGEYYQSQPLQDDDLRIKLQPKADVYLPSEPVVSFRGLRDPPAPSGGGKGADRRIVQQSGRHK